jgi:hypothetical protein
MASYNTRGIGRLVLGAALLASVPVPAGLSGQGAWALDLFVDPYPSPYPSDWETNPHLSSLTILNPTGEDRDVTLVYQVVNSSGRTLASGRSDRLTIPAGAPTIYTSYIDIAGSSSRDPVTQAQVERTGRIPEGTYRACVTMADANGFVLGESCATFTIVYPDPAFLLSPAQDEVVTTAAPFFQWTPVQVPAAYQVRYELQLAEVLPNQTPEEALQATILHFERPDLDITNLQYPIEAQPLEPGKRYAWRIVALDEGGFPPATNGGASEIRTFRFDDGSLAATTATSGIRLSLFNAMDEEDGGASNDNSSTSVGIKDLCEKWDSASSGNLVLDMSAPIGFKRFAGQPAWLFKQGNPAAEDAAVYDRGNAQWWIRVKTPNGRRDVLIEGICNKTKTKIEWIASRDSTLQQKFNDLFPLPDSADQGNQTKQYTGPPKQALDYAVVVLSGPGHHTVQAPDDFAEGVDFFKGHNEGIDVALGLNVYAVFNLATMPAWQLFQAMDYPERQVTLTGFLGWDATWNIGIAGGDEAGVDVSNEKKFLVLHADLPERHPRPGANAWYKSMNLGFEFSIGDSTGFTKREETKTPEEQLTPSETGKVKANNSFDIIGKVTHTIVINDKLTLVGELGIDRATAVGKGVLGKVVNLVQTSREKACPLPKETTNDLVMSYAAETDVPLGSSLTWEGLKLDLKLGDVTGKRDKFVAALSSTLGVGGREGVIKLGGSMEQKLDKETSKKDVKTLEAERNDLKRQLAEARLTLEDSRRSMDAAKKDEKGAPLMVYCDAVRKADKLRQDLESMEKNSRVWRFRASAGHMSLGELLASLKDLVFWITNQ